MAPAAVKSPKLPVVVLQDEKGELRSSPPGENYKNDYLVRWSITPKDGVKYSAIEFEFVGKYFLPLVSLICFLLYVLTLNRFRH